MAVRLDQETVIKYADKVFMGLALVLLLIAVAAVLMPGSPAVTYQQVVRAYETAVSRQDASADWEQIEGLFNNTPEDQEVLRLLRSSPTIVSTYGLQAIPTPRQQFVTQNETLPQPVWGGQSRFAAYLPIQKPQIIDVPRVRVPALAERVAPRDLLAINEMAYLASGQEANGTMGIDVQYVAVQMRIDLDAHVEAWKRAAAAVPRAQQAIRALVISRYEVQRRELKGDAWSEWRTIPTVRLDEVMQRPPFPRPTQPVIAEIAREARLEQDYVNRIRKYQSDLLRVHKDILRPPFYTLGSNRTWVQPYAWHKFAMDDSRTTRPTTTGTAVTPPPAGGIILPGQGGVAPLPETAVAQPELDRKQYTEMWFNDVTTMKDGAGKTFQYRSRVWYLNPYIGLTSREASAEDRLTMEFESQWSEPTTTVTLPEPVRFFFVGQIGERANVDMYRWIHGQWYQLRSRTFEVGEDINFDSTMELIVPIARGTARVPRVQVGFNTGASIVDLRDDNLMVSGTQTRVKKMIYMMQSGDVMGSLIDRTGRDASAVFWNKANEARLVAERAVDDRPPAVGGDSEQMYDPASEEYVPEEGMLP